MDMSAHLVLSTSFTAEIGFLSRRTSAFIAERRAQPLEAYDDFLSCVLSSTPLFIEFWICSCNSLRLCSMSLIRIVMS
jgi:hypothetical protein